MIPKSGLLAAEMPQISAPLAADRKTNTKDLACPAGRLQRFLALPVKKTLAEAPTIVRVPIISYQKVLSSAVAYYPSCSHVCAF